MAPQGSNCFAICSIPEDGHRGTDACFRQDSLCSSRFAGCRGAGKQRYKKSPPSRELCNRVISFQGIRPTRKCPDGGLVIARDASSTEFCRNLMDSCLCLSRHDLIDWQSNTRCLDCQTREIGSGQLPVVSGQGLPWPGTAGRTHDRLATGTYGRIGTRRVGDRLEPRAHGGIATGGRCGGSPPAQGRAGTARPSIRVWMMVRSRWGPVPLGCYPTQRSLSPDLDCTQIGRCVQTSDAPMACSRRGRLSTIRGRSCAVRWKCRCCLSDCVPQGRSRHGIRERVGLCPGVRAPLSACRWRECA